MDRSGADKAMNMRAIAGMSLPCVLGLLGCAPDTAPDDGRVALRVDGVPMLVELDHSFSTSEHFEDVDPATGEPITITTFPSPPKWVVVRNDDKPTSADDRPLAMQAVRHFCAGRNLGGSAEFTTSPAERPVWLITGECRS